MWAERTTAEINFNPSASVPDHASITIHNPPLPTLLCYKLQLHQSHRCTAARSVSWYIRCLSDHFVCMAVQSVFRPFCVQCTLRNNLLAPNESASDAGPVFVVTVNRIVMFRTRRMLISGLSNPVALSAVVQLTNNFASHTR